MVKFLLGLLALFQTVAATVFFHTAVKIPLLGTSETRWAAVILGTVCLASALHIVATYLRD